MKKIGQCILLLCMSVLMAGCAAGQAEQTGQTGTEVQEETETEVSFRTEFTDSELAEGRASFQVAENLYVDAEITPYDSYKDGVNSYYMVQHYEEGDPDDKDGLLEDATLFGKTQEEFLGEVSEAVGVEVTREDLEGEALEDYAYLYGEVSGEDGGAGYEVLVNWLDIGMGYWEDHVYYPVFYMNVMEEDNPAVYNSYGTRLQDYMGNGGEDLDFASREDLADELMEMIEDLTGRTLSDIWDCVIVTGEAAQEVNDSQDLGLETDFESYYDFSFYYEIDGFPVENLGLSYTLQDGETCTKGAMYSSVEEEDVRYALNEQPQRVAVGASGILYLKVNDYRDKGDVYKEGLEVVSPSEVIALVEEYYDTQLLLGDVTITQIRLVYSGYFTSSEDGEIDNAFCPFWKVVVYDSAQGCYTTLAFDAAAGE